jgi:hypothetical protein
MASKETPTYVGVSLRLKVGETPIDRENFVKGTSLQTYDGMLFNFNMDSCVSVNVRQLDSHYICL